MNIDFMLNELALTVLPHGHGQGRIQKMQHSPSS